MESTYQPWIGRERCYEDEMNPGPSTRLWRTFDSERTARVGEPLQVGWQWLHFLPQARQSKIGTDGHELRGEFLPPVAAARRMFAGGKARFEKPLILGTPAVLNERIARISTKTGRGGELVFVDVERRFTQGGELAIEEQQTIVYCPTVQPDAGARNTARVRACEPHWRNEMRVDATMLFRFSALTFNAHRIHYDRQYCEVVEGYSGLVVHGPLVALLLLEQARERIGSGHIVSFEFRALQPVFEEQRFALCGRVDGDLVTMWAERHDGTVAMQANARCI